MAPTPPLVQGEQLTYQQDGQSAQVTVGSAAWFRWLETASTFTYHTEHGTFTARLERSGNKRGGMYWRAYRRRAGKLRRAYLGKSVELTLERLQMVAALLAGQGPVEDTAPDNASEPGAASLQSIVGPQGRKPSALPTLMTRSTPPQEPAYRPSSGRDLPTGTTTLLFTDVEGSTRLLQRLGKRYAEVLTACRHLLRVVFQQHHGHEVDTQGDAFFVVFARATDAVVAAVAAQRALVNHSWPEGVAVRVRMGLHTGEPQLLSEGYVGLDLHHAARIMSAGHGGQVLLSQTTRELVEHVLPEGTSLRDLGEHRLKDLQHPTHLYQLVIEGLAADFPPLKTVEWNKPHDSLLATKLHQPRPRSHLVSRSHLIERLQQGMEGPLTLVSAPTGFGKTTLLAQWLAESGMPAAWLSLESEDNEPVRFLSYLLVALQTLVPRIGVTALALLHSPQPAPAEMVLTLLANDLAHWEGEDFALVLDDYHVITDPSLHRHMMFLLEHLPAHMHLIIATRADPPLPLSRLRARGQLVEVRADELRFETSEVRAFLHTVMGLDLSSEVIAALAHRTEGWIAGLQLAALALQGKADVSDFVTAFRGSHRFVLDYLSSEVLSRQSAQVQDFLLRTSILNRLCGSLCEAVANQQDGLVSGQAMLEALEQANLFVVPLDDERRWYRYHYLFAEVLQSHLQRTLPTLASELHLRASAWYEQRGLLTEAVQHALAASDVERAAVLLESIDIGSWAGHGEQIHWMLRWLERLPEALVQTHPKLCIAHAVALMFTNQLQQAEARLQAAERSLESEMPAEQTRIIGGYVAAIRGNMARYTGDLARCVALSQQALDVLPEEEMTPRTIARVNLAHTYLVSGDVTALTERLVAAAVMPMRASGNASGTLRSLTTLAHLQVVQGRLRQAASTYEEAARLTPGQEGLQTLVGSPSYYFGMADLLYERNALEAAEQNLRRGLELVRLSLTVDAEVVTLGYTTLARLQMARAEYNQALTTLNTFTHLAEERPFAAFLIACGAAVRAQVELAQGNLEAATSWLEQSGISAEDDHLGYLREQEYLTLARVRIAQGRHTAADRTAGQTNRFLQDVLHLLRRLLADAEAKARGSSVLELLLLQTLVFAAQGERNAAFSTLERGLSLAEPEGYVRLFVDEGAPMLVLLRQAWARGIIPQYVATLLAAFGEPVKETAARPPSPAVSLSEPLTEREREVLQLLAEGASNREIAQRLIVSTGTVKKYVYNICGKLGVQSRMQALVRARALHLL